MGKTTKILLGLTTLGILATSAMACPSGNFQGCMQNKQSQKMMKMRGHQNGGHIMGTIMRLDLNEKQQEQIMAILKESRQSMQKPSNAFSDSQFDKENFIKSIKEQKEAKIKKMAETIEKVYALLNSEQKKNLKMMLESKAQFKGGKYCDQNCNGRG